MVDNQNDVREALARACAGGQDVAVACVGGMDAFDLMAVELDRGARSAGAIFDGKDFEALGVEHALVNERSKRRARLKGGVELDERLRPEKAVRKLLVDVGADPVVADREEAADVAAVIADDLLA
jgi:hypothetical protein